MTKILTTQAERPLSTLETPASQAVKIRQLSLKVSMVAAVISCCKRKRSLAGILLIPSARPGLAESTMQ